MRQHAFMAMAQTELVAILLALEHAQHRRERTVVLHTDSRTGLQALQQPYPSDNVGLVTAILGSLQSLAAQGRRIMNFIFYFFHFLALTNDVFWENLELKLPPFVIQLLQCGIISSNYAASMPPTRRCSQRCYERRGLPALPEHARPVNSSPNGASSGMDEMECTLHSISSMREVPPS
ncbi:hypothetical protein O3P69_003441 [Scylla paramamosain]|uniref:RNase H type-1 domain-containing protein n=1 Tax=Scylla paramamosain TaxID=85552 RepID=A0AAW0UKZ9_SCYPA